eukprot:TRINITY_DN3953_c0_g1_i2.p1 TRINITY_DN3953_c0_g1~~TRINITY_DN3953_c0_g1_i2.p1  ORF type:complete len:109 (+),score=1.47 TRINITY_DN3953_c0_g1_i2:53-379(+)
MGVFSQLGRLIKGVILFILEVFGAAGAVWAVFAISDGLWNMCLCPTMWPDDPCTTFYKYKGFAWSAVCSALTTFWVALGVFIHNRGMCCSRCYNDEIEFQAIPNTLIN